MTQGFSTSPPSSLSFPPLLIPGPLTVSQGLPGDGLRNSLTEPVPVWRDLIRESTSNAVAAAAAAAAAAVPPSPPVTSPSLASVATDVSSLPEGVVTTLPAQALHTNAANTTTRSSSNASSNSSAAASSSSSSSSSDSLEAPVNSNNNDNNNNNNNNHTHHARTTPLQLSAELQQAMELWQEEANSRQLFRYKEWKEALVQSKIADNNNNKWIQLSSTTWWRCRGQVAVWSTLPGSNICNTSLKSIASLPPGTVVNATDIYEWNGNLQTPPRKLNTPGETTAIPWNYHGQATGANANDLRGKAWIVRINAPKRGYCIFSVDGYPLLLPGGEQHWQSWAQPSTWYWKVTCPAGAYVREGLELQTRHLTTLQYGTIVQVLRQRVNQAGLPRIQILAHLYDQKTHSTQRIQGWCSTQLNPLSGQRGFILQPLPLPRPMVYRIVLPQGAVIRQDLELASPVVGHAPYGSWVTVLGQAFSDFPADRAVARLRLAGGGWISTRLNHLPPHDLAVVELVGVDQAFDPAQPAWFHYHAQAQAVQLQMAALEQNSNNGDMQDGAQEHQQQQQRLHENSVLHHGEETSTVASSAVVQHRPVGGRPVTTVGIATRSTVSASSQLTTQTPPSPSYHQTNDAASVHPANKPCLCCMENPRDATLVHGGTGHIVCCLQCARILQAQGQSCPVCRLEIDSVIKHYFG